jgi:hypothetical protein
MPKPFPRKGAWAKKGSTLGIINKISGNSAEFHTVDSSGDTLIVLPSVPLEELEQASWDDIKGTERCKHLTEEQRVGLGY